MRAPSAAYTNPANDPAHEPDTARIGPVDRPHIRVWPRFEMLRPVESSLTSRDYTLLEGHLWRAIHAAPHGDSLLVRLIRTKLADARIAMIEDIEPNVVTGNSRVRISIDGSEPDSRVLTHWTDHTAHGSTVLVPTLLGATLLGMRAGERAPLLRADGTFGHVFLEAVTYQPEAERAADRIQQTGGKTR